MKSWEVVYNPNSRKVYMNMLSKNMSNNTNNTNKNVISSFSLFNWLKYKENISNVFTGQINFIL